LWIKAYKRQIWKEEQDRRKLLALQNGQDWELIVDDEFFTKKETGPMLLEELEENTGPEYTKRTVDTLKGLLDNDEKSILAVHD
jgi:hypothetical protein